MTGSDPFGGSGSGHRGGYSRGPQGAYGPPGQGYGPPGQPYGGAPGPYLGPGNPSSLTGPYPVEDIEPGKVFAILCYVLSLFWIVPLITRDNAFSLYHAKQALVLTVAGFILAMVTMVTCGFGSVLYVLILYPWVMGLIHAVQGEYQPMPWIGHYADKYLAGTQADKRR